MYTKTIVCLARSSRPGGLCVAGRELTQTGAGAWIRPVSARPSQEISAAECLLADGSELNLLDVVEIDFDAPEPGVHQQENHRIAGGRRWRRRGRKTWNEALELVENPPDLWIDGHSSGNGRNNRVPELLLGSVDNSLYLIAPMDLSLDVADEQYGGGPPKRKLRANFEMSSISYRLTVSDPKVKSAFARCPEGTYEVGDCLACISLAEVYDDGHAYKVVASLISQQPVRPDA